MSDANSAGAAAGTQKIGDLYRCHKIVRAAVITEVGDTDLSIEYAGGKIGLKVSIPAGFFRPGTRAVPGDYYVIYDEGYTSWSPKATFEAGYKPLPKPTAEPSDKAMSAGSSLAVGDAIAAAGATGERVTLAGMEARIVAENWFTAADALKAMGKTPLAPLGLLTICTLVLDNGWVLTGTSACADPKNFDPEKGRKFAREDALRSLWPLEGYLLRQRQHELTGL